MFLIGWPTFPIGWHIFFIVDTRKRKLVFRAMAHRLVVCSCDVKEAQISFLSDGLLFGIFLVEAKRTG